MAANSGTIVMRVLGVIDISHGNSFEKIDFR